MPADKPKRKLAAILSADAAGYSRLMEEDEAGTLKTLKAHFQVMSSQVENHRGRVVAVHGDSLLAEFDSVVVAVQCAMEIQKEIAGSPVGTRSGRRTQSPMLIQGPINYEGICLPCDGRPNRKPSPLDWRASLGRESQTAGGYPNAQPLDERSME